ncbi:MAG: hypothetical protein GY856_12320 [bacterium]|nr:hypothetical protein [bacterium]
MPFPLGIAGLILGTFLLFVASPAAALVCGDGVLDPRETCDDGNSSPGDCCSASCELLECSSTAASPVSWEELGPFSLGGRVSALAVSPQDPQILYAGTPAGGVWRSDDGGLSWTGVAPWLGSLPISALAVDPNDPDVVLLGTGAISDGGVIERGIGILRTTDGGLDWSQVADSGPDPYVAALLYWDEEPQRALAATDLGIRLSEDGGTSFREVLVGAAFSALARDPFAADGVYAASRSGLYGSSDRGESWSELSTWPLLATDAFGAGTTALTLSHQTPGLLYATVQVLAGFDQTDRVLLLRSFDGGQSFEELATAPPICPTADSCGFAQALALDPGNDDRLLLGGDRLYVVADAGWKTLTSEVVGVHEIVLHAGGTVVAGTSGVTVLDPSWTTASPRNDGLAITAIVSLDASHEPPRRLLAGTADSGSLLGVGEVPSWSVIFGDREPAGAARFDPFDPDRLYVSGAGGLFHRSDDGGVSFVPIQLGLDLSQPAAEVVPLEPSPLIPGTLFAGRMQLHSSVDAGDSWSPANPVGFPEIFHIAVSAVDSDRLYFSLASGGEIYLLDDVHTDLLPISAEQNLRVTSLYLDPDAENVLYAALTNTALRSGRVFKSYDFGAHWQDVTPPDLPAAHSIVKAPDGVLYLGTAEGVRRSANDGFTWYPLRDGLTASGVLALRLADGELFAGTTGRGIFRLPLVDLFSIDTIPSGQRLLVDGELVRAPFLADWDPGSPHTVGVYLLQTADTREEFISWSDGGAASHAIDGTAGNASLTAAIRRLYRLRTDAPPPAGGTLLAEPPSADGFYESQSFVTLLAVPDADHRFAGFTGELGGSQEILGFALMDRPRSVSAEFEPLVIEIATEPPGLEIEVDGTPVTTPFSYQWAAGSEHQVSAPEIIDLDPGDDVQLAFDRWSDLLPRDHGLTVRRDTFITDLTAHFIPTVPALELGAGTAALLRTPGVRDAPRVAALTVRTDPAEPMLPALQIVRGTIEGTLITELALVPSAPQRQTHAYVEGGGSAGRARLVLHNPWPEPIPVDLLLRDPNGIGLVLRNRALTVPAHGHASRFLCELMQLSETFAGHLSVFAPRPLVVSVQSVRENLRPTSFIDPILVVPFLAADQGVPADPRVQALLLTPDTEHRLALVNPGTATLSGWLRFLDQEGRPLGLTGGASASQRYLVPPGGYQVLRFRAREAGVAGRLLSGQVRMDPNPGQSAPLVQLIEERALGSYDVGSLILPRSLPPSRSTTEFAVPIEATKRDSGVILTNRDATSVEVRLSAADVDGVECGTVTVAVPAEGQVVALTQELLRCTRGSFRGILRGSSASPVDAVGLLRRFNQRGEEILAGFPVLDVRDQSPGDSKDFSDGFESGDVLAWSTVKGLEFGAPAARSAQSAAAPTVDFPPCFPYAVDGDSWSSEWWFLNPSSEPRSVDLNFRGESGETRYLPMEE